jgi:RHS repeat-associated protein
VTDGRVVLNSGAVVTGYNAVVKSAMDYSAFGAPLSGRTFSSPSYKYGFNGMEKDAEMHDNDGDSYDFGARMYDARVGRWLSVDPLHKMYPSISVFAFVGNSPIKSLDPNGEEIVDANGNKVNYSIDKKGRVKYTFAEGTSKSIKKEFRKNGAIAVEAILSLPNGQEVLATIQNSTNKYHYEINNDGKASENIDREKVSPVNDYEKYESMYFVPTLGSDGKVDYSKPIDIIIDIDAILLNMADQTPANHDIVFDEIFWHRKNQRKNTLQNNIGVKASGIALVLDNKEGKEALNSIFSAKDNIDKDRKRTQFRNKVVSQEEKLYPKIDHDNK